MKKYIQIFISLSSLVAFDQWTKYLAVTHLKNTEGIPLIPNVFHLHYLENRGVAFGMFQDKIWFFLPFTMIILAFMCIFYSKIPDNKRYIPLKICAILVTSGAIGNMIDRFLHHYVVDFLYFKLIDFPIFNVADCYVVVGVFLFILLLLFYYKEEELERDLPFFSSKSKKGE